MAVANLEELSIEGANFIKRIYDAGAKAQLDEFTAASKSDRVFFGGVDFIRASVAQGMTAKVKSLQWAVCESEVLRDPSLPPAARKILTELADLKL